MIPDNLKPNSISDLVFRMDEYLAEIRRLGKDSKPFSMCLANYLDNYFSQEKLEPLELKKTAVEMTDGLYVKLNYINERDVYTDVYFKGLLEPLFSQLAEKGILVFFILDNTIRDDRFKMITELYSAIGFTVVHPYQIDRLEYSPKHTKFPVRGYKEIEQQIDESVEQGRHVFYVEKDDNVNYIKNVIALAEEFQHKHLCVFRNKDVETKPEATWLMGYFGDILD